MEDYWVLAVIRAHKALTRKDFSSRVYKVVAQYVMKRSLFFRDCRLCYRSLNSEVLIDELMPGKVCEQQGASMSEMRVNRVV
jgi:hypothetical protein